MVVAARLVMLDSPLLACIAVLGGIVVVWVFIYWYRLTCEFIIVFFDIAEILGEIRDDLRDQP